MSRGRPTRAPDWTDFLTCRTMSTMKTIAATQFKQQCLALLESVDPEGIVITKHGKPIAKLVPIEADSRALIGSFKGKIKIKGDIRSTGLRWHAQS